MNIDYDIAMLSQIIVALSRIKAGKDTNETLQELNIYKPMLNNVCRIVESMNPTLVDESGVEIESDIPAPTLSDHEKLFCTILRTQDLTLVPSDLEETLEKVIKTLNEKEEDVIRKRYFEHKQYVDISKEYDVTGERIKQIERRALRKLRDPHTLSYLKLGEAFYRDCKKVALEKEVLAEQKRLKTMQELTDEYSIIQASEEALLKKFPELNLDSSSELVFVSVYELGLSTRALRCLIRSGIDTVRDLGMRNAYDLLQLRNLGRSCVVEIADAYDSFTGQKFDRVDFTPKYNVPLEIYLSKTKNRYK